MHNLKLLVSSVALLGAVATAQSKPSATLTSSSPFSGAGLGTSVAVSGSTIAAGGEAVINGQQRGVVYVFTKAPTAAWADMSESAQLTIPNGYVGASVGLSGDANVIVSVGPGEVCVFVKPVGGWQGVITPAATLLQSPPAKPWILQGNLSSVAMNSTGNTIVAGAYNAGALGHLSGGKEIAGVPEQGAAYVWVEPAGGWANANGAFETAKLTASDGIAYDHFGLAVGMSANTILAGAPSVANGSARSEGAAYLFARPSTGIWHNSSRFSSRFTASDATVNDSFGVFIAAGNAGALVAVGSARGCGSRGATYVFARPSPWWPAAMTQTAELTPSDSSGGCFGGGIAVGNQLVVVGAPSALSGAGAAYTFARPADGWTDLSLPASMVGGSGAASFGTATSSNGPSTVVGAPYTTVNGNTSAGAVYVFID